MQAFEGIKIVDFTQVLAGPFAVMQLALLGATVIKVEHPIHGDQTRGLMNLGEDKGMSPSFMGMNLNKQSIGVDLKSPAGIEVIKRLLQDADVVVENFKAGTMESLGLGYEIVKGFNSGIIYCSVTGYGQTGPKAGEAAYDGAIQASSGMMSQTGHPQTGPTRTGYMPVDMSTALNTAFAISAALFRREKSGEGQRLDVAMLDTAIVAQAAQYNNYLNQGTLVGLLGNGSPTRQPTANVFATADGYVQITALRQQQVATLFAIIGLTHLLEDERFATPEARIENGQPLAEQVSKEIAKQTTDTWVERLASQGVPVARIRALPEVLEDEQLDYRDVFASMASPIDPDDTVKVVKAGYVTDKDGPMLRQAAPLLGQHTDQILSQLGYTAAEIAALKQSSAVS